MTSCMRRIIMQGSAKSLFRLGKVDSLFHISHLLNLHAISYLLDLHAGGRSLFVTSKHYTHFAKGR